MGELGLPAFRGKQLANHSFGRREAAPALMTDLPAGMWSVLPLANEQTATLVADPRLPVVSFTGSEAVGYHIQASQPTQHVILELGGNAAAVVLSDWSSDEDLDWAATRIATFGTYQAGQSCVSVQRVLVDESLRDRFIPLLVEKINSLKSGSPLAEDVVVGQPTRVFKLADR